MDEVTARRGKQRNERARKPAKNDPRAGRRAERREAILAAALEEFSARGFEATRLDDVARRAGVAKGTIYLYFRDKQSLFQELVRTMLSPLVGAIEAALLAILWSSLFERFAPLDVRELMRAHVELLLGTRDAP